jgi:hypothetical protein
MIKNDDPPCCSSQRDEMFMVLEILNPILRSEVSRLRRLMCGKALPSGKL